MGDRIVRYTVDDIIYLTQEEGMKDRELAEYFGVHRTTITRFRSENNIPKANLKMRKDKSYTCDRCKNVIFIRTLEHKQ